MHICSNCLRHIRESECPFCHAVSDAPAATAPVVPSRRGLRRSALVASVVLTGACYTAQPAYGIAVDSGGQSDAADAASDTANAPDGPVAAYGIAPQDASQDDAATAPDGPVAAYGIAPADAGQDDAASAPDGPIPAYGIAPQDSGTGGDQ